MKGLLTRRFLIITGVILVVSAALLYSFRAVVRETIIIPISYLFWLGRLFLESTPQFFFWIMLLIITAIVIWRSFRKPKKLTEAPVRVPDMGAPSGRVSYWAARVDLMKMGEYYESTFNEAVGRLALDLLAYRHRLSNRQIERGLTNSTLHVPADVRDFLLTNVLRRDYRPVGFLTYLYRSARLWFYTHFPSSRPQREQLKPSVQSIIHYMEEELEVHYDHTGQ